MNDMLLKYVGKTIALIIGVAIGLGTGIYKQNREFQEAARYTQIMENKQLLLQLQFVKDEFERNVQLLANKDKLKPSIRILDWVNHREEIMKHDPILRMFHKVSFDIWEEIESAKEFLASEDANNPAYSEKVQQAKGMIEMEQIIETFFGNSKRVIIDHFPHKRFAITFSYKAQRNNIFFSLPMDYAITLNRMYGELWFVNDILDDIEEMNRRGELSVSIMSLIFPFPDNIRTIEHLQTDLEQSLQRLSIDEFHQFLNRTKDLILQLEQKISDLEK